MPIFQGKAFAELEKLEVDIVKKIKNAGRGTDVSFWENLLDTLRPQMARQRLKELHQKFLKIKLEQIRAEQLKETQKLEKLELNKAPETEQKPEEKVQQENPGDVGEKSEDEGEIEDLNAEDLEALEAYDTKRPLPFTVDEVLSLDDEQREAKYEQLNDRQLLRFTLRMYESGRYSPTYGKESLAMPGIEILSEKEDVESLREVGLRFYGV
uniref:Cactin_mid domain-containing protein n=1 Tax=Bursaphelenchus xylophilus TaxID=6326 RepID=A0A1I7SKV0_BURXY